MTFRIHGARENPHVTEPGNAKTPWGHYAKLIPIAHPGFAQMEHAATKHVPKPAMHATRQAILEHARPSRWAKPIPVGLRHVQESTPVMARVLAEKPPDKPVQRAQSALPIIVRMAFAVTPPAMAPARHAMLVHTRAPAFTCHQGQRIPLQRHPVLAPVRVMAPENAQKEKGNPVPMAPSASLDIALTASAAVRHAQGHARHATSLATPAPVPRYPRGKRMPRHPNPAPAIRYATDWANV